MSATLPPVPFVDGPLAIRVVYPPANASVPAVDSNFMIGSVGTGRATLTIDGIPARVSPNGAFIAWVATPRGSRPAFSLVAAAGADTVRAEHPLRASVAPTPLAHTGRIVVDTSEFGARRTQLLRDDEMTTVRLRAPANATVTLRAGSELLPLTRTGEVATFSRAVPARLLRGGGTLLVARGSDTLRLPVAPLEGPSDDAPRIIRLGAGVSPADSDFVIYGRPLANDAYRWFFLPGTAVQATGRTGGYTRIRLDSELEAWVADADVEELPAGTPAPSIALRTTGNARLRSTTEAAELVLPVTAIPTFFVEQFADRIELTLYNTRGNTDVIAMQPGDSLVRHVSWEPLANDRVRFILRLGAPALGYHAIYERGNFILRVRRAPRVDPAQPLRGVTIALDPGHPPAGGTGPTALYEGQAVLWVAERAKALLEARGARVIMTRTTMDTLALHPRRVIARRGDAHAFVSIHLNAYPDGVNPFLAVNGTGTYFYRAAAEPLARAVQHAMLRQLGLPDEGIFFRSLGVIIQSWMPAVLLEGAYVIIPEQEAAMRTAEYQMRYATAIVEGLEAYFRGFAR